MKCRCNLKSEERYFPALRYLLHKPKTTYKCKYQLKKRCKKERKYRTLFYPSMSQYFTGFIFKGTFNRKIMKVDRLFFEFTPFQDISSTFSVELHSFFFLLHTSHLVYAKVYASLRIWANKTYLNHRNLYFMTCSPGIYGMVLTITLKITDSHLFL